MFENVYHSTTRSAPVIPAAAYQALRMLSNPPKPPPQPCGTHCIDKVCDRTDCPLGD